MTAKSRKMMSGTSATYTMEYQKDASGFGILDNWQSSNSTGMENDQFVPHFGCGMQTIVEFANVLGAFHFQHIERTLP